MVIWTQGVPLKSVWHFREKVRIYFIALNRFCIRNMPNLGFILIWFMKSIDMCYSSAFWRSGKVRAFNRTYCRWTAGASLGIFLVISCCQSYLEMFSKFLPCALAFAKCPIGSSCDHGSASECESRSICTSPRHALASTFPLLALGLLFI